MDTWKLFTVSGRVNRSTWWSLAANAVLLPFLAAMVSAMIAGSETGAGVLGLMVILGFWMLFSASLKRMHDLNRSGIWLALWFVPFGGIVLFAWLATSAGTSGVNSFGEPDSGSPFKRRELRVESA